MIKEFSLNNQNAILNFSIKYCNTPEELLNSTGFTEVLHSYTKKLMNVDAALLDRLKGKSSNDDFESSFKYI